ncbi:MAG: hypothetical protein Q8O51_00730 [bacterium]|nr:hypothetical protein [bacterium]
MAFSKWFWDVFPKRMTALWWLFMIALVVVTAFWRDPVFNWFSAQPALLILGVLLLLVLVFIGNYIPGIPNMLLPLFAGWALGAGASYITVMNVGLLTWLAATLGSKMIFMKARRHPGMVLDWNLHLSERYKKAADAVRSEQNVIVESRFGKLAAYCGHINIAAGIESYSKYDFVYGIMIGHTLWTLQYLAFGFAISWLLPYVGTWIR